MVKILQFKRPKSSRGYRKKRRVPYWVGRPTWKLGIVAIMGLVFVVGYFLKGGDLQTYLPRFGATNAAADAQGTISGTAYAIDGDTIRLDGKTKIRLSGVAAPEKNERGGYEATDFMKRLINGKTVRCELDGTRTYDRVVGICFLGGRDIGKTVIAAGLARDCPRYSGGRYKNIEQPEAGSLTFPAYCQQR